MRISNKKITVALCALSGLYSGCITYYSPTGIYGVETIGQKGLPSAYRCLVIEPDSSFTYYYRFDLDEENTSGTWKYTNDGKLVIISDIKDLQQIPIHMDYGVSYNAVDSILIVLKGVDSRYSWYVSNGIDSIPFIDSRMTIGYDFVQDDKCHLIGLYKNQNWINMIRNKNIKTEAFDIKRGVANCIISMDKYDLPNYVFIKDSCILKRSGLYLTTSNVFLKKHRTQ